MPRGAPRWTLANAATSNALCHLGNMIGELSMGHVITKHGAFRTFTMPQARAILESELKLLVSAERITNCKPRPPSYARACTLQCQRAARPAPIQALPHRDYISAAGPIGPFSGPPRPKPESKCPPRPKPESKCPRGRVPTHAFGHEHPQFTRGTSRSQAADHASRPRAPLRPGASFHDRFMNGLRKVAQVVCTIVKAICGFFGFMGKMFGF
eukprot:jgi/Tetstr1/454263/TSEL_041182.t1